jgi:aldose 1-epimerase
LNIASISETKFLDTPAIILEASDYRAIIVPEAGGNLVSLRYEPLDISMVRTPDSKQSMMHPREFYGMPLLFPPNHIAHGSMHAEGKTYSLPQNDRKGMHFLHDMLRLMPWRIIGQMSYPDNSCELVLGLTITPDSEWYTYFPHTFECRMSYRLSQAGLRHSLMITNTHSEPFPVGVGFHTALNVPFVTNASSSDYRLRLSVGERWELDENCIPTGRKLPLTGTDELLCAEGIVPLAEPISTRHYTCKSFEHDGWYFSGAVLTDIVRNITVAYKVDPMYRHWVLWNDGGDKGYVCPEPMSWMIDAPNSLLPAAQTGFAMLAPNEVWRAQNNLSVKIS